MGYLTLEAHHALHGFGRAPQPVLRASARGTLVLCSLHLHFVRGLREVWARGLWGFALTMLIPSTSTPVQVCRPEVMYPFFCDLTSLVFDQTYVWTRSKKQVQVGNNVPVQASENAFPYWTGTCNPPRTTPVTKTYIDGIHSN